MLAGKFAAQATDILSSYWYIELLMMSNISRLERSESTLCHRQGTAPSTPSEGSNGVAQL